MINDESLDKFFKLYSLVNCSYAKVINVDTFLVSSYYKKNSFIYPIQFIDFDLIYKMDFNKITARYNHQTILDFIENKNFKYNDVAKFLCNLNLKVFSAIEKINASDIVQLNNYFTSALTQGSAHFL